MKQWLPTLLLVIACIGGIWYATSSGLFSAEEDLPEGVNKLVKLKNENIQEIRIKSESNDLTLKWADGAWRLEEKPELRVSKSNVDGWVNTMILMVHNDVIDEKATDLAQYGLDKPKETYTVKRSGEPDIILKSGEELPSGGARYVTVGSSKAVYKVSSADLDALNKGETDLIEKNPITVNYDATERIEIEWREYKIDLRTDAGAGIAAADRKWKLNGKKDLTNDEMKSVLTEMSLWETNQKTEPLSSMDTSQPDLLIRLTESANGEQFVREYIGMIGAEVVYVAEKGSKYAYAISGDTINSFVVKTHDKAS